jgi:cytochrome c5
MIDTTTHRPSFYLDQGVSMQVYRISFLTLILAATSLFSLNSFATSGKENTHSLGERSIFSERAINERLTPSAKVCMEGDSTCQGASTSAPAPTQVAAAQTPEQTYQTKCMACHGTGAAGAPKVGDEAAWKARAEKGIDTLVKNAISGVNAMPPKGMCMDCSDADIKAVVEYMISQSVKK